MSGNSNDDDAFYNPYQFVPMGGARPAEGGITADSIRKRENMSRLAHDHYAEGTLSGRIVCRLTTESEIVIGGNRQSPVNPDRNTGRKGKSAIVHPVLRDGKPIIPATGLRGCISSIAEAISFSTMRVMADDTVAVKPDWQTPASDRGSVHEFFAAEGPEDFEEDLRRRGPGKRKEWLPHSRKREIVTAAEAVFGFVSDGEQAGHGESGAYRGRVRFSDAVCNGGGEGCFVDLEGKAVGTGDVSDKQRYSPLKALGEPKATSSVHYFHDRRNGNTPAKGDLCVTKGDDDDSPKSLQQPLGRKFYLHGSPRNNELLRQADRRPEYPQFWRGQHVEDRPELKSRALPLARGLQFFLHIDFDNLSPTELGLLVTALSPAPAFRHKIGMGKPIGLGTVHIEIAGVLQVDRQTRYGGGGTQAEDPFSAPRHHAVWLDPDIDMPKGASSRRIRPDARADSQVPGLSPLNLREQFTDSDSCDQRALEVVKQIGDPKTTRNVRVHYPTTLNAVTAAKGGARKGLETDGFRWFATNEAIRNISQRQKLTWTGGSGERRQLKPNFRASVKDRVCLVNEKIYKKSFSDKITSAMNIKYSNMKEENRPRVIPWKGVKNIDRAISAFLSAHKKVFLVGYEGMAKKYPPGIVQEFNDSGEQSAIDLACRGM